MVMRSAVGYRFGAGLLGARRASRGLHMAAARILFIGVLCPVMPELWRAVISRINGSNEILRSCSRQVQASDLDPVKSIHDNGMLEQTHWFRR